jgi:hypothetical protein
VRFIFGLLAFAAVWLTGWFAFGIHPSLAEALLVVVACGASDLAEEVLE